MSADNVGEPSTLSVSKKATTALVLSIIGLVAWIIPLLGLPITVIGLILSIKRLESDRKKAIFALVLSIVGLILTVVSFSIGSYIGWTELNDKKSINNPSYDNTLPMYGAESYDAYIKNRNNYRKSEDDAFIKSVTDDQGLNKTDAAKKVSELAWYFISIKDLNTAFKRFNQIWLLDQSNFNAYFGFAIFYASEDKMLLSATYFDKAIDLYSEDKSVPNIKYRDLSSAASEAYIELYKRTPADVLETISNVYYDKAIRLLSENLSKNDGLEKKKTEFDSYLLAYAYIKTGKYAEAKKVIKQYPEIKNHKDFDVLTKELSSVGY